jgi:hypothetical protein
MKKKDGGKLIIIIALAAVITLALVLGYRFLKFTNGPAANKMKDIVRYTFGLGDDSDLNKEPYEYKQQSSRTYKGKKLYQSCGYIYNDSGEVLADYQVGNSYGLQISFDIDRKRGVFINDSKGYIINADLGIEKTIDNCNYITICYEGDYVCYSQEGTLYIYDVMTREESRITDEETAGFNPTLSPDGRTVLFTSLKKGTDVLYIGGLDRDVTEIATADEKTSFYTRAVSDDGLTCYYECRYGDEDGIYVYYDGKMTKISTRRSSSCYFDRECKKILVSDDKEAFYYDTSLKERVVLVDKGYSRYINIFGTDFCQSDIFEGMYIVDTNSFSDVAMISTGEEVYALQGDKPKAVLLAEDVIFPRYGITAEGPVCIYKDDEKLMKSVNINGEAVKTEIISDVSRMDNLVMTEDLSAGYYDQGENNDEGAYSDFLYSFKVGEEPKRIKEIGNNIFEPVRWDKFTKKCYYISNGNLYSMNNDGTDEKLIGEGFSSFTFFFGGDEVPVIEDADRAEYLIIGGEVYKK